MSASSPEKRAGSGVLWENVRSAIRQAFSGMGDESRDIRKQFVFAVRFAEKDVHPQA